MSAGVGFASSANQTSAAQAKKQKRRAMITPVQSKAEIRAAIRKEPEVNHALLKEAWRETVAEMKLVITDMRARKLQEAQPKPVKERLVFLEFVQVVEDVPAVAPAPQPAPVAEPAPAPLLLMPPRIAGYLPARCGKSNYDVDAAQARAAIRAEYEAEMGVTLPEHQPIDLRRPKFWFRNEDGTLEKRHVS